MRPNAIQRKYFYLIDKTNWDFFFAKDVVESCFRIVELFLKKLITR